MFMAHMNYIGLGTTPVDEDCVQVGQGDYMPAMRKEAERFRDAVREFVKPAIDKVREKFGENEIGEFNFRLRIKSYPHDFGSYLDVEAVYDEDNKYATGLAFWCESELPSTWNELEGHTMTDEQIEQYLNNCDDNLE